MVVLLAHPAAPPSIAATKEAVITNRKGLVVAMLKIGSRVYAQPNMDDINLRDLLRFDVEVAELGVGEDVG